VSSGESADAGRRRSLLLAALGFARLGHPLVHRWLTSWEGIGLVAAGMARQGYDLSLTRYDGAGWRATFYVTGREHSPTAASASVFAHSPFSAVRLAAWHALTAPAR
jgi:hypothetical protein